MDLIYANAQKEDIGILQFYELDMAYGADENNFQIELNLSEHCMDYGYFVYAEHTEYGGIVDSIYVDNGKNVVRYSGRSWHGILANSVIIPDGDYLVVSGDANAIITDIIKRQGLDDIFSVSTEDSGVYISEYSFRYQNVYEAILEMLREFHGKLVFSWKDDKIQLSCQLAIDFTNDDEWDSSQMEFEVSQNNRPVNHLVCLGQGNLADRAVIHLFTDEDGNIQPYASENPMEDADYITDMSGRILSGIDEVAEVYDYSSAEVLTTYIPLDEKPEDFITNHTKYFKRDDDSYKNLEVIQQEQYTVLASQPSNWATGFNLYYEKDGDEYRSLESVTNELYSALASKPQDWGTNYGNYYKKDGSCYVAVDAVTEVKYKKLTKEPKDWKKGYENYFTFNGIDYDKASGDSKPLYKMHTGKPSDWDDEYSSYYWKVPKYSIKTSNNNKGYETYISGSQWMTADQMLIIDKDRVKEWESASSVKRKKININKIVTYYSQYKKNPKWVKDTYYNRESKSVAPQFRANYYYSMSSKNVAPEFVANQFYSRKVVVTAPTFMANTYYSRAIVDVYEDFVAGQIFRQSQDRFATLVTEGIKKLQEAFAGRNSARVDLEELQEYDVNDIVGARENTTALVVKHYITKKIVNIKNGVIKIDYTVGKE